MIRKIKVSRTGHLGPIFGTIVLCGVTRNIYLAVGFAKIGMISVGGRTIATLGIRTSRTTMTYLNIRPYVYGQGNRVQCTKIMSNPPSRSPNAFRRLAAVSSRLTANGR